MDPVMHFKSHIQGKNADVRVFPDRIEWARQDMLSTGAKATLGMMTGGLSLAATGIRRHSEGETIPISAITHVGTRRGKGFQTEVVLTTSGGDLAMRVSQAEAQQIIQTIQAIQRGDYDRPQTPPPAEAPAPVAAPAPAAPQADVTEQLRKLGELRDMGILTAEEFDAKKLDLLARL